MTSQQNIEQQAIFNIAYRDYEKKLNKHALFKVGNSAVGEDLVQDTFMKTWRYLMKGGKVETMKVFLYHVLNGCIVDQYRKRKTTSLDTMVDNGFEPGDDYQERLLNLLDGRSAFRLIKLLPLKYQTIMRMHYIDDLSLGEMSFKNKQSKNTNSVQLHRGFEKLKLLYRLRLAV